MGTKPKTSHNRPPGENDEALDDLPRKEEIRPSSVRRTLKLFQRQGWETFDRQDGTHMVFSERIDDDDGRF